MKLRAFFSLFFLILVALAGINLYVSLLLAKLGHEIDRSQEQLKQSSKVADDFLTSSQNLTKFSRAYVITRNPSRREYYDRINEILDGKIKWPDNYNSAYWDLVAGGLIPPPEKNAAGAISIEKRFLDLGLTVEEFNKLKEAKVRLQELARPETTAFHAVNGEFDDGTGSFVKKGKPDQNLAIRLLHNPEYNRLNGEISRLIEDFIFSVRGRFNAVVITQQRHSNELLQINSLVSAAIFGNILVSILFLKFRFADRAAELMKAVQKISSGNLGARVGASGNDEIGELAGALDKMATNLDAAFEALGEKVKVSEQALVDLEMERTRSEKLLHNILPAAIAERLRQGEETIAEVYPEVTVLFSDIVGFTELAAKLGPHETINMLNSLFGKFDELAETFGLEKIKTIGDSYMVVGGVPTRDPLHCQHIADFALAAERATEEISSVYPYPIKIRIGIHTGTVAAGVVGKKKFSYDLWGDVVNVASRFQSTSQPDRIHVSEAVRFRLIDDFMFEDVGQTELKGKGFVASFYLLGRRENYRNVLDFAKSSDKINHTPNPSLPSSDS
jgi:adenylate cyclase